MVIGARFLPTGFINKFSEGTFACLSGMHAVCFHLCFHLEAALTASSCSHFMVYLTDMPAPSHPCALLLPLQQCNQLAHVHTPLAPVGSLPSATYAVTCVYMYVPGMCIILLQSSSQREHVEMTHEFELKILSLVICPTSRNSR